MSQKAAVSQLCSFVDKSKSNEIPETSLSKTLIETYGLTHSVPISIDICWEKRVSSLYFGFVNDWSTNWTKQAFKIKSPLQGL